MKRKGRQEVGAAHTTDESGELVPREPAEGRGSRITEPLERQTSETKSSENNVSTKLQRIAELAKNHPDWVLTTLAHVIDIEWLEEAFRRTRKSGAVGVDGQTAAEYARDLEVQLTSLLSRLKSGNYRAPPVRRVLIPKGDGKQTRPIGIPTFEDKVLQRAVAMVLEAIYEQDFLDCSYGFRPHRSAHQALEALGAEIMSMHGGWIIELDIASFYDTLDHQHLNAFLDQRVKDGVIRRVIGKWLNAGVLEDGAWKRSEEGTPQGGVISPLLANIYLHEVLDTWFARDVQPRLKSRSALIRYADDAVIVLADEDDARRLMAVLPKRFEKYGLRLHPEKTRLVRFQRPPRWMRNLGKQRPETFDFLGFTLYWGRSRKDFWIVKKKTASSRLTRALKRVREWCRTHAHFDVGEQRRMLALKLQGHYGYFGITGNNRALARFFQEVQRIWRHWLDRRSSRARMTWARFIELRKQYPLPGPRIVHSIYASTAKP